MERTFVMTWIYYNLTLFVFRFAFLFSKGRLAQHFTRSVDGGSGDIFSNFTERKNSTKSRHNESTLWTSSQT